jgi:hypothetical protein
MVWAPCMQAAAWHNPLAHVAASSRRAAGRTAISFCLLLPMADVWPMSEPIMSQITLPPRLLRPQRTAFVPPAAPFCVRPLGSLKAPVAAVPAAHAGDGGGDGGCRPCGRAEAWWQPHWCCEAALLQARPPMAARSDSACPQTQRHSSLRVMRVPILGLRGP